MTPVDRRMRPPITKHLVALLAALTLTRCKAPEPPGPEVGQGGGTPPSAAGKPAESTPPLVASAPPAASLAPAGPPSPLNVLLLTIDSLRQDMPWTGYPRPIAPNLTKLAAESVVYTRAYSSSSTTAKSVAALLSGRHPSTLYRNGYFFAGYSKSNLFLQEVLQEQGVRTLGLHAHLYFGRGKELDQGFDVWGLVPGIQFDSETDKNVTSEKLTNLAIQHLGAPEAAGKPFFAWLHYMDPHDEYIKHPESPDFGKKNRDRYDSEVFYTDLHVGRLLHWARQQPFWGKTAVIVSADHGESFGEHDLYKHAFWLWDVVTRVPLLVHAPGAKPSRIHMNRSHIDLAPTILELCGGKSPPGSFMGRSLVPEIYGLAPPDIRDPIVLDLPEDSHNPPIRAIVRGEKKLIVYGKSRFELYDLEADPGEKTDLARSNPDLLADMKAEYAKLMATLPVVAPYGGNKLREGGKASGPTGPAK